VEAQRVVRYSLYSRLIGDGEIINLMMRPLCTTRKTPGTDFCSEAKSKRVPNMRLEGLGQLMNQMNLSGIESATFRLYPEFNYIVDKWILRCTVSFLFQICTPIRSDSIFDLIQTRHREALGMYN
jgi:hypothetical protein